MTGSTKFRDMGTKTSLAMRIIAAVVLVCWSVSLSVCWHHCATGACSGSSKADKKQPSCHAQASDDSGENKSKNDSSACFAKKPLKAESELTAAPIPALHLNFTAAVFVLLLDRETTPQLVAFRQASEPKCVFTPEVCLGPAFRSLAPPATA